MTDHIRLLPCSAAAEGGKPAYLITDRHGGTVSRIADVTESVQLEMGERLLVHARGMLPSAPDGELRYLAVRLAESLQEVLRVAESRGERLSPLD
ncbi:hypothetical protein AB0G32_05055 [Streptomyces sp. NPDC023723]|uniref:hypothetical protein n=1 Tax=Streptomyces sp. NPDC023723 TaxID=3154323 RepID=UPI0033DE8C51